MKTLPVGIQLYSLRDILNGDRENFKAVMQQLRDFGYDGVELADDFGFEPEFIRDLSLIHIFEVRVVIIEVFVVVGVVAEGGNLPLGPEIDALRRIGLLLQAVAPCHKGGNQLVPAGSVPAELNLVAQAGELDQLFDGIAGRVLIHGDGRVLGRAEDGLNLAHGFDDAGKAFVDGIVRHGVSSFLMFGFLSAVIITEFPAPHKHEARRRAESVQPAQKIR